MLESAGNAQLGTLLFVYAIGYVNMDIYVYICVSVHSSMRLTRHVEWNQSVHVLPCLQCKISLFSLSCSQCKKN